MCVTFFLSSVHAHRNLGQHSETPRSTSRVPRGLDPKGGGGYCERKAAERDQWPAAARRRRRRWRRKAGGGRGGRRGVQTAEKARCCARGPCARPARRTGAKPGSATREAVQGEEQARGPKAVGTWKSAPV